MPKGEAMFGGLSDAQRRGTIQFVVGNLLFTLLHEARHVQITEKSPQCSLAHPGPLTDCE